MSGPKRIAILISGRGSNMVSLIAAARQPDYPAAIALVISNRPEAAGLARAAAEGAETAIVDHRAHPSRESFEAALQDRLDDAAIDLICLAGFMRLLTPAFVERWRGRMINIHPSLLPAFKGLHTHRRALEAGVALHGCTVHFVEADVDSGPIVVQAALPVRQGDDENGLAARVLQLEHVIYPLGLKLVASGEAGV